MSGECDKCGEHCLDCKCNEKFGILKEEPTIFSIEHIKISINKEYFKKEFRKILDKWDYKLANGMDMYDENEFLNDLINTME